MTILERHRYAPELNRLHVRGAVLRAPGAQSIRDARALLFRPVAPGIWAEIRKTYPAPWSSLSRTYAGRVATRADAIAFARRIRDQNRGGPLLDGSTLPAPAVTVRTRLVG